MSNLPSVMLDEIINSINNHKAIDNNQPSAINFKEQLEGHIKQLNIYPCYPIILIGGTNGKGSTCAYLTNILINMGYNVGTFTSPHVMNYNERISVNGININNEDLINLLTKIILVVGYEFGLFKIFTLCAHMWFSMQKIDIAVFEVGIGGRCDIANFFEPIVSAITSVDFDHCELLGNTLELIALEKAHIYRPNCYAFFGGDKPQDNIINYTNKINATLQYFGKNFAFIKHEMSFDVWCDDGKSKFYSLPYPAMRSDCQLNNITLAIAIIKKLKNFTVTNSAIKTAIIQTKLKGRFDIITGSPQIIIDVAHNAQSITTMLNNLSRLPFMTNNIAIFGLKYDKDIDRILQIFISMYHKFTFQKWYLVKLSSYCGIDNDIIKNKLLSFDKISKKNVLCYDNTANAISDAMINYSRDRIICFGSFDIANSIYKFLNK